MKETIDYIIRFMLGEQTGKVYAAVGYTADESQYAQYKVVIRPSGFFDEGVYGTAESLPRQPLAELKSKVFYYGIPVIYGEPRVERRGGTLVLHADLVAGAYFLMSRYEEMVRREVRDEHGRFPGLESLLGKVDLLYRPLVDEYGDLLRELLGEAGMKVTQPAYGSKRIYLTHDVDAIAHYRSLRGVASAALKNRRQLGTALKTFFGGVQNDPWFTFPWLLQQDALLGDQAEIIFFIKSGGGRSREDQPRSRLRSRDFQYLFRLLRDAGAKLGLHASYEAGKHPELIAKEKAVLEKVLGQSITYNRHHYLASREPEDMQALIDAGITDDFTMGYADMVGFRLGTCRAVRWINPVTRQLTPLTLHPLTAMDGTLSEAKYLGVSEREAMLHMLCLMDATEESGGDLCLLWHNTSVTGEGYHRSLYRDMIDLYD